MKIYTAAQLKEWDNYTIAHEPVSSVNLMERAAQACVDWLLQNNFRTVLVFCGTGNNGGDGLAIARLLLQNGCTVSVFVIGDNEGSDDYKINLGRFREHSGNVTVLRETDSFPSITKKEVVIDALFGTGLNKPCSGVASVLIQYINQSSAKVISIDIPSGLFADKSSSPVTTAVVKADFTLTFQQYKLSFLMAENREYFGKIIVIDIHLHPEFYQKSNTSFELTEIENIHQIYIARDAFGHKGNFGYACLLAGSYGMMGAAVLAAKACLRSGTGKLTCVVCKEGYQVIQTSVPEAMAITNGDKHIRKAISLSKFNAVGIGPGIGIHTTHNKLLHTLFNDTKKPMVIDADALNILSANKKLLAEAPPGSILTPHPAEFDRLFTTKKNRLISDFERMELAREKAAELKIYILVKGHHTLIAGPDKGVHFNSTGNAGMATAGSGDVLTGILTGLLAQGYSSLHTCILGVYLHGLAGDIAAQKFSEEAMIAGDIISCLGEAFKEIAGKSTVNGRQSTAIQPY
ncbi:MAG: NAD(P)H-hydrate dehydratase [Ginsengibacter sp.]